MAIDLAFRELTAGLGGATVNVGPKGRTGTIHDVMLLNPITNTPPVRGAVDQATEDLREVFAD